MNLPVRTAFAVSHKFWTFVSSFSFVSRNFLVSSLISFLTHSLFNSMIFNLHEFECFWIFSLRLFSFFLFLKKIYCYSITVVCLFSWGCFLVSGPCGLKWYLLWFQFSWICWGLFSVLPCGLSLKMFHVHLKRMCILLLWCERLYIYQLSPFHLGHWSMYNNFVDILFGRSIHFWQWGVKIP